MSFRWTVDQGSGVLDRTDGEYVEYRAPEEPELAIVSVVAEQEEESVEAESFITVTADLLPDTGEQPGGARTGIIPTRRIITKFY